MRRLILALLFLSTAAFGQSGFRDEFDGSALDASWILVRNPDAARLSLAARKGFLRLRGSTVTLSDLEVPPVYAGRKQEIANFEATTEVDFNPRRDNEFAGIALRRSERAFCEFGVRRGAAGNRGKRVLFLRCVAGSLARDGETVAIPDGVVRLRVRGFPTYYRFSYAVGDDNFREIGGVEAKAFEAADGLRNVEVGPYASGNGVESTSVADFAWFDFNAAPKDPYADLVVTDPTLPKGYTIFSVDSAEKGIIQKYPFISRPDGAVPAGIDARREIVYANYGARAMHCDMFRPTRGGKLPAVIIVHGGAWITGHYTMENPLAIALAKRGYVAVTVEHRLSREKKYPAQIHDLKAAVRFLRANARRFGIDENRIGAVGASSGGHLVALLGSTNDLPDFEGDGGNAKYSSRVQSVVDIDGTATFIDPGNIEKEIKGPWNTNTTLTGFTYAENPEVWKEASPITHVSAKSAPTLFLNSSSNRPFQQREEMMAKLNALGIASELVVVPDTPHPFWLFRPWFDTTVDNIDRFFAKTLKKK